VTLQGSNPVAVTVTVTTRASSLSPPAGRAPYGNPSPPAGVGLGLLGLLAAIGFAAGRGSELGVWRPRLGMGRSSTVTCHSSLLPTLALGKRRPSLRRAGLFPLPMAALLLAVALCASCGGGGGGNNVVHTPGTPAGDYGLTIRSTSGTVGHSINLTLIVQ
jgi:hypothetical protein